MKRTRFTPLSVLVCLIFILAACQQVTPDSQEETNPQLALTESGNLDPQYVQDYAYAKAFVWADQPTAASYVPNTNYQYNNRFDQFPGGARNTYPAVNNTITRLAKGSYRVDLPNFNFFGGVVHVTSYNNGHCNVKRWFPNGTKLEVFVNCFSASGSLADTRFNMLFYKNANDQDQHGLAYLLATRPTTSSYTPPDVYQYNSKGASNSVTRTATGSYTVTFPAMLRAATEQSKGGTVLVTAYGQTNSYCKVQNWGPSSGSIVANVRCYTPTGVLADTIFTASFMREPGTLGIARDSDESTAHYVWANNPSAASYTPNSFYQAYSSTSPSLSTITRFGTGRYRVTIPELKAFNDTLAIVTGYGSSSGHCNVGGWGGSPLQVYVYCFTASGISVDDYFVLYYLAK